MEPNQPDIVIIGSGAGGGTLAYGLKDSGLKVLILERGEYLPREPENHSIDDVYAKGRYFTRDDLVNDRTGIRINNYSSLYWVGGKTKLYGAALIRLRQHDFAGAAHAEGNSVPWPMTYDEMEPFYCAAEKAYHVHGAPDPSDPQRSQPFPFPPREFDPYIKGLAKNLEDQGIKVHSIPTGFLDDKQDQVNWNKFDCYPSPVDAKADADVCCVRPALESGNVSIMTGARATRLITDDSGKRVVAVEVMHQGEKKTITAGRFVVAGGAVHSPALLLESRSDKHPNGLANSSGMVGRNLMLHNFTMLVGIHPFKRNRSVMQKSLSVMEFYARGPDGKHPLGSLQMTGPLPLESGVITGFKWGARLVNALSVQWMVMSEDLPRETNRITSVDGKVRLHYEPSNLKEHKVFTKLARKLVSKNAFPIVWAEYSAGRYLPMAHACGTVRAGNDPRTSVLDGYCRTHDVENLYVVDSSFFPSSGAVNPALTVMAQALRVAKHLASSR